MTAYPEKVVIEEQGFRDGFQNEKLIVPTEKKTEWIHAVTDAGIRQIQMISFVHPKLIPQMADAEELCARLEKKANVVYSALVLNVRGMKRAVEAGLSHVSASLSASDTHSRKNTGTTLGEARKGFGEMVRIAKQSGLGIRGGIQCAFGCRFEGKIDRNAVFDLVREQLDFGVDEMTLADTTGMADPRSVQEISEQVLFLAGDRQVYLHLHDTEGKGLANAFAAIQVGIRHFETAFAGMGGCPFITGASGNISTDDLALMLEQMGIGTGISLHKLGALSRSLEKFFGKSFSGKAHRILNRDDIRIMA